MALWRFEIELPDGSRDANVIAAGNLKGASERAERYARSRSARLVMPPTVIDSVKGSM